MSFPFRWRNWHTQALVQVRGSNLRVLLNETPRTTKRVTVYKIPVHMKSWHISFEHPFTAQPMEGMMPPSKTTTKEIDHASGFIMRRHTKRPNILQARNCGNSNSVNDSEWSSHPKLRKHTVSPTRHIGQPQAKRDKHCRLMWNRIKISRQPRVHKETLNLGKALEAWSKWVPCQSARSELWKSAPAAIAEEQKSKHEGSRACNPQGRIIDARKDKQQQSHKQNKKTRHWRQQPRRQGQIRQLMQPGRKSPVPGALTLS